MYEPIRVFTAVTYSYEQGFWPDICKYPNYFTSTKETVLTMTSSSGFHVQSHFLKVVTALNLKFLHIVRSRSDKEVIRKFSF